MTVEELNIKISADAENFRRGLAEAQNAVTEFRNNAVQAAGEVTRAFDGLINVGVASDFSGDKQETAAVQTAAAETAAAPSFSMPFSDWRSGGTAGFTNGGISISPLISGFSSRTANVLRLENSETVIGAVGQQDSDDGRPVNITTTVELDGDKVGESVNRFNLRRNKITNGIYG